MLRVLVGPFSILLVVAAALVLLSVADHAGAAFPGNNGQIAFDSDRDGNYEIYVMNADGTGQTRLTNNPALDGAPAWSPDGSKIAFVSDRDGNLEIYVMPAAGGAATRLTNNTAGDDLPDWQPLHSVGGIAELPDVAGDSGSSAGAYAALASGLAAALVTITAGAWYTRRRWGR